MLDENEAGAAIALGDDLIDHRFVAQDAEVEIEDSADLLAVQLGDVIAQSGQIGGAFLDGGFEALDFGGNLIVGDVALGDYQILRVQHDGRVDHHAGRNADALFNFHSWEVPILPRRTY